MKVKCPNCGEEHDAKLLGRLYLTVVVTCKKCGRDFEVSLNRGDFSR